ncbi:hypothetical protein [Nocardia sp. BMG111209]|uniref:hypothetical protein n=1 Tax=Nocardia sp. BMG111209 TaxID=1160137 RepID=UPI0003757266|nr:hypothetical protein [Nocardia sp. BMG111209]
MSRRYRLVPDEVRATSVARCRELMAVGFTQTAACRVVAANLGVHYNTVGNWVRDNTDPDAHAAAGPRLAAELAEARAQLHAALGLNRELMALVHDHGRAPQAQP